MSEWSQVQEMLRESVRDLPVLPTAVTRLLTLTQQPEVRVGEISSVIETDPTLMARTLRLANSPLYRTTRSIKTVQQATVLLGIEAIVNLALSVSVASVQEHLHKQLPIDTVAFGRHNTAVALAARKLARHAGLPNSGEAFVAGLLHDIGKLVLLMQYGEAYAGLMLRAQQGEKALHELEQEVYGLDHAHAGHALCLHWNLSSSLTEAVATHHTTPSPHVLGDIVQQANNLVKTIQLGYGGNRFITGLPGEHGDLATQGWLRSMILDLYAEINHAEEALGCASGSHTHTKKQDTTRPRVQLQITNPEEQAVVMSILLALGFEPTLPSDSSVFDGPTPPTALVTEAVPSDRQRRAYQQLGVLVLDYEAFRQEHEISENPNLDVCLLGAWLSALPKGTA